MITDARPPLSAAAVCDRRSLAQRKTGGHRPPLQLLTVFFCLFSIASFAAGRSDIADAVMKGNSAALPALLQQRADVNAPQPDGATALHWAAYRNDLDAADLLIRAGASPKATNREGASVLSLACINGSAAMIEKLL